VTEQEFPVRALRGLPVVAAPAEIDISNVAGFGAALEAAGAGGHPTLVVDLTQTVFCDSSTLRVLALARQRAEAAGGEVRLVMPHPALLRVFEVTGMIGLFPIYAALPEALNRDDGCGDRVPAP
jgi:anti-sigma B factor antagonist